MIALQELIGQEVARIRTQCGMMSEKALAVACRMRAKMACERGQGTTEYAILVGV